MKRLLFTLLLNLTIIGISSASSLYILYDESCMDRLEYVYENSDDGGEYIVYQVTTNPGEKIVLEVGTESTTPQDFLPAQFIKCNNAVFDSKLVNTINSNIDQVFMVVRKGSNRYFVSPINFAARYLRSNDYILYDSPKYRFQFDLRNGTIGENIAYKNPDATVNFEGKLENECTGEYIFRQYSEFAGNPHTDLVLVPELGIVEERSGVNAADAIKNTLQLNKVNGMQLDRYLRRLCNGKEDPIVPVEPDEFTAREVPESAVNVPGEYNQVGQPFLGSKPSLPDVGPPPSVNVHTVKKGETLYRISKRYSVTVDQLRAWNGKGNSNTIYPGEELQVSAGNEFTAKGNSSSNQVQEYTVLGQRLDPANPSSYNTNTSAVTAENMSWAGSGRHTVSRGETVASIAMKYGYTEQRFRDINKIGPNEYIKVGQVLKTDDCDCPDTPTQRTYQAPATVSPAPGAYYTPNPGLTARSPEQVTVQEYNNYQPRAGAVQSNEEESFSNENFNRSSTENDYRNTPYFLRRSTQVQEPVNNTSAYNSASTNYNTASSQQPYNNNQQNSEFYTVQPRSGQPTGTPDEFYTVQPRSPQATDNYRVPNTAMPGYQPVQQPQSYNTVTPRSGNRTVYIVKDGDTLYSIARAYGISIEQIRSLNDLERGEVLIPYQKIYLN
jgi:LysM repeat protein